MSSILQRFIWALPLKFKRKFIAALDAHLSEPLSDVQGLVEELARRQLHSALCPAGRGTQQGLRSRHHWAILATRAWATAPARSIFSFGSRCCATSSATTGVRSRRADARQAPAQGRLPGQDPYSRNAPAHGAGKYQEALELIEAAIRCPTSPAVSARRNCSARACAR